MRFKGILLDIDNTLYEYAPVHEKAMSAVITEAKSALGIPETEFAATFRTARKQIHAELAETASSHNRLLYFQRTLELLGKHPAQGSLGLYDAYWNTFLNAAIMREGAIDWLKEMRRKKIQVCLFTDLTGHIQHRKINVWGLAPYFDVLVTSEEAGIEKPHPYIFLLALKKMDLMPGDVCVVGDNFDKDIAGAYRLGIKAFWLTQNEQPPRHDDVIAFHSFSDLRKYFS
jgi:HAD superfamily hydrolase (TIGR01549 family)